MSLACSELVSSENAYVMELKRGVSLYMSPLLLLALTDSCVTEVQVKKIFSNWTTLVSDGLTPSAAAAQWLHPRCCRIPCFALSVCDWLTVPGVTSRGWLNLLLRLIPHGLEMIAVAFRSRCPLEALTARGLTLLLLLLLPVTR